MTTTTAPAPPPRSPTARRHSTATMTLARTMYADGEGWTPNEIAAYLLQHGTPVAANTVRRWVHPDYARRSDAKRYAKRCPAPRPDRDAEPMERALALRNTYGLPYPALAVILREYHGVHISAEALRHKLVKAGAARDLRKARAIGEQRAARQ